MSALPVDQADTLLQVEHVSKRFGGLQALSDVGVTATDADKTPRSVVRDAAVSVIPMVATLDRSTVPPRGVVSLNLRNSPRVSGEFLVSTMRSMVTSSITTWPIAVGAMSPDSVRPIRTSESAYLAASFRLIDIEM